MSVPKSDPTSESVAAQAAEWFVTLESAHVSEEEQAAFADWLRRSPVHVEEFLQVTMLHGDLRQLDALRGIDVSAIRSQLEHRGNVLTWADPDRNREPAAVASARGRRRWVAIAAGAAAVLASVTWLLREPSGILDGRERYATAVGEQRSVILADGSQVKLNTRSRLAARLDEGAREVELQDGEALFAVAKDPTRPFRVRTPQAMIEARGTQFNVHVKPTETVVSLLEGKVDVQSNNAAAATSPIHLAEGEQVVVSARASSPRPFKAQAVTAWTERRLVFENAPLVEVVAEFNRYSRRPLVLGDPALRDVRLTAVFYADDSQAFAESLRALGNLALRPREDGAWIIEAVPTHAP